MNSYYLLFVSTTHWKKWMNLWTRVFILKGRDILLANGLIFLIVISSVGLVVVSDCSVGNNGGH